jgi:hypothetical protein
MAHDKRRRRQCIDTTDEDYDNVGNNDNVVPIFALFYWLFYPLSGLWSQW